MFFFTFKLQGSRGGFAEIDDEVAAVLAFVIFLLTFLAAQDDDTRGLSSGRYVARFGTSGVILRYE